MTTTITENTVENSKQIDEVMVIHREDVPHITEVKVEGKTESLGELRDFRWHEQLKKFLPHENNVSFSWTKLKPHETLNVHTHSTSSMIIICEGTGKVMGDQQGDLKSGDIVAVSPGGKHGFIGTEPNGFTALSVQFGAGLYTDPENPRTSFVDEQYTFESLEALNNKQIEAFRNSRFIHMVTDGTLKNPVKRQRYVEALQIWSNKNQDLLFARQGTTTDEKFLPMFLEHLFEEVGHDRMHADRKEEFKAKELSEDPIIEAVASWFICQMFRTDNIIKTALIHMVIENASFVYHTAARPILAETVNDEYFEVHEADTEHAEMGLKLLRHLSQEQYHTLHNAIKKGWDMLNTMAERVCQLTDEAK